ncbi:MAG: PilC/PilY family type IV pilus protein, partial [Acetobacteraceae bacterium]
RTILVVGLNAGGKAYDAVDITDPAHPKLLWEFASFSGATCPAVAGATSDCNLGLTYGVPVITKVNGHWVVLVTSGYNNVTDGGDGGGYLYAINAATGQLAFKIATGVGSTATPSGLAQINAFVENTFVDNTSPRAYGGDEMGNLWRFELFPTPTAQLLGIAKTSGNLTQPISTRPELSEVEHNPMIMVGTGRLLGASDVTDIEQQSVYGFLDTLAPGPVYADLRGSLRPLAMTKVGSGAAAVRTIACSGSTIECARTAGWVLDLPEAGERININMKLNFSTLVFASNVPKAESCTVGGHSWFNYVDYQSGLAVPGAATVNLGLGDGSTGQVASSYIADSLTTGFNIYRLPPTSGSDSNNGRFVTGFVQSDTTHPVGANPPPYPFPNGKRISWREIVK